MLTSYKKISVIYGGNGRKYASQIKDKLQDLHEKEFYPIKIEDLNTDWVGHDVLGTVVKTIRNSDLIYIVFTLDDIGASKRAYEQNGDDALVGRLRQNVLIELGMALVVCDNTEKIKIVANFNKNELGEDFPSDIRNALSIREFSNGNFDEVLDSICRFIRNDFDVAPTKNLLHDEHGIVDFENVFDEFEKLNRYGGKKIKRLWDILDLWLPTLDSFDYVEERLLYTLERLKSFPVFGSGEKLIDWIKKFRDACLDPHLPITSDREFIRFTQDVVNASLDYTLVKTDESTETSLQAYKDVASDFSDLYDDYKDMEARDVKFHPVISFVLLEYYGLTLMRIYNLTKDSSLLDRVIALYQEGAEVALKLDTRFRLYQGYVSFNLGRAYYYRYRKFGNEEDCTTFHEQMEKTLKIRKRWTDHTHFLPCYANALSYEYFYALSEYVKMQYATGELSGELFDATLDRIISDIDDYICNDSELQKLYKIKNVCLKMYES